MNLNFSGFKTVQTANTKESARVAKGQTFNAKFKKFKSTKGGVEKLETIFTISNKLFDEMSLAVYSMIQVISPEGVTYLATVDNDNGTIVKRTGKLAVDAEKGRKFKSSIIEEALSKQGIIDLDLVGTTQKLDFNKVAEATEAEPIEIDGTKVYAVYEVAKAADAELTEEEKAEDATEDPEAEEVTEAAATVAATTTAKASAPKADDDF